MTEPTKEIPPATIMVQGSSIDRLNERALGAVVDQFYWEQLGTPNGDLSVYNTQIEAAYRWLEFAALHGLLGVKK